MTLLGKVFTSLIFFLSVIFFVFSVAVNATHVNNKEVASNLEQEARESESRNSQLETLRTNYKSELEIEQASRRTALASLQTQYEAANYELLQKEAEAAELRQNLTIAAQNNDQTQKDLRAATNANRQLRQDIAAAEQRRDELFSALIDAKDDFNQLQGTYQSLSDRANDL